MSKFSDIIKTVWRVPKDWKKVELEPLNCYEENPVRWMVRMDYGNGHSGGISISKSDPDHFDNLQEALEANIKRFERFQAEAKREMLEASERHDKMSDLANDAVQKLLEHVREEAFRD